MEKLEARLAALEYVTSLALVHSYAALDWTPDQVDMLHKLTLRRLGDQSLTKLPDPALSDLRSAEVVEAVERLLKVAAGIHRETVSPQSP